MIQAILSLLLVQFNFGILPVAQKTALTTLTPQALFALRSIAGAFSFALAFSLWKLVRKPSLAPALSIVPRRVFVLLSFLGIAANQFTLIIALTMTSSVAAVIIVPSITLFTFFFAILLRREVFSWSRAGVLLLGALGVLILFADGLFDMIHGIDTQAFYGNLLCLFSAAVYALYLVLSRDWSGKLPALQFTTQMFFYAALWSLVFLLAGSLLLQPPTVAAFFWNSPARILAGTGVVPSLSLVLATLTFIVLGPTVLNYFLNFWVLARMPASTVSGFISLQTLIGATVSHLLLHEPIKRSYGLAAACIIVSIVSLSWQSVQNSRNVVKAL